MPQSLNLNTNPIFSDFDPNKNYYRILFRPETAVQARELTNLQAMAQDQIEKFGSYVFRNGSIVDGCALRDIPILPYVFLKDAVANTDLVEVNNLIGTQVVSNTSNLTAKVLYAYPGSEASYPNTNMVYLSYLNTGTNGEKVFSNNETLTFYKIPRTGNNALDVVAVINTYTSNSTTITTGNAHGVHVSNGVIFQKGFFIQVYDQIGIVSRYNSDAGNNVVGFVVNETIVTPDQDSSLNDNALGYPNVNAPGAYRLKLTANLTSLDQNTAANTTGFNPVAIYNYNNLVNASQDPNSLIEKSIAARTYESQGNFVVQPFTISTESDSANSQMMLATISPGSGYAEGYRVSLSKAAHASLRRGVDVAYANTQALAMSYGNYLIVKELSGNFDFSSYNTIELYDAPQYALSAHGYSGLAPVGNVIGSANIKDLELLSGLPGTPTAQYALYLFNVKLNSGKSMLNVKSVYFNGTHKGVADLVSSAVQESSNKRMIWTFGQAALSSYKNKTNAINTNFWARRMASDVALASNGMMSLTISTAAAGGTDSLPYGDGVIGDLASRNIVIVTQANSTSNALSGTVTVSNTSTTVTGTTSNFINDFSAGEYIAISGESRLITSVINSTSMTTDLPFSASYAANAYSKHYPQGYAIPISSNMSGNRYVLQANTQTMTISTGCFPSTAINCTVYYDILRSAAVPAKKQINKNRFVNIDTTANPKGPWCLGFSDIHNVSAVYAGANGSVYSNNVIGGVNILSKFKFSTGQTDSTYGLGYLYSDGADLSATPYLTVQLDYFTANTTAGVGFFTIDSYPIDDANTANSSAIQTIDLPLYIAEDGSRIVLSDCVDFRPLAISTATDTGSIDVSNISQLTTAIAAASVNPANTLSWSSPAVGAYIPSPSGEFISDIQYYLGRTDLFMLTSDSEVAIKAGAPATNPQPPVPPDNTMAIAYLFIPPYPSLCSDEIQALADINNNSLSQIRNTRNQMKTTVITNRRYTMKDIGTLDQRITNLEYYASLSLLEQKTAALQILDSNGLNQFKNGLFVDPFNDYSMSDVSNPEFRIAIDMVNSVARPYFQQERIPLKFNLGASTGLMKTGRALTLSYGIVPFLRQPFATKYRSAAPAAFAWNGTMALFPCYSNAQDTVSLPNIQVTLDNATPWQEFAASPFGSQWGSWNTTTSTTTSTSQDPPIYKTVYVNNTITVVNTVYQTQYVPGAQNTVYIAGNTNTSYTPGSGNTAYVSGASQNVIVDIYTLDYNNDLWDLKQQSGVGTVAPLTFSSMDDLQAYINQYSDNSGGAVQATLSYPNGYYTVLN